MRRLLPTEAGADAPSTGTAPVPYGDLVLADASDGRPWLALGMVASMDGAAAVDGRTADLGGAADLAAFRALRDAADAVLVGAATVRAERYGPGVPDAARRARRVAKGLTPAPRVVVVSASAELDDDLPLLAPPAPDLPLPVLVAPRRVPDAVEERLAHLGGRVEVRRAGEARTSGHELLAVLADLGLRGVLCEGGPRLAGMLLAEDLVDEVFLTLAPVVALGDAPRIAQGSSLPVGTGPRPMALVEAWEDGGELLLRYRRDR